MATHKYRVGQKVELVVTLFERFAPKGDYQIVVNSPTLTVSSITGSRARMNRSSGS